LADARASGSPRATPTRGLPRLLACAVAAASLAGGLSACGAGGEGVAAQVGRTSITTGTLHHWMALTSLDPVPDAPGYGACVARRRRLETPQPTTAGAKHACRLEYLTLEQRALDFLIVAQWTTQQAEAEHLAPSAAEVKRQVAANEASGATAISEPQGGGVHPGAEDMQIEATAVLASAKIRGALAATVHVTPGEIADYYRRHRPAFLIPERRYFDLDNLHSQAAAIGVKREVESGKDFATMSLHEELTHVSGSTPPRAIERAIFAARPHVLGGPVLLSEFDDHSIFEVTRIIPAVYQTLAQVQGAIAAQLTGERRQRALAAFIASWRARWVARTNCRAGYLVPPCRQYAGSHAVEPLFGLG